MTTSKRVRLLGALILAAFAVFATGCAKDLQGVPGPVIGTQIPE
ncbi:hypothetical protein [Mycobacterium asiaticum]|nr:hypothetical protein [Mycobacterium asiaticum]